MADQKVANEVYDNEGQDAQLESTEIGDLNALLHIAKTSEAPDEEIELLKQRIKEKTRWLMMAMKYIGKDPLLQLQYGNGMDGARKFAKSLEEMSNKQKLEKRFKDMGVFGDMESIRNQVDPLSKTAFK